ncbi:ATP-binding cassette domain-containing protein [Nocardioides sp. ChNu-153]|uniref:ABC transporter ATP-binding protein n=1 Tax=Nocardioides sp. ChNu-153 TaxID=2779364 RepID=UPI00264F612D|nr:ATP-binding cassette domain-containing protein [Nocardioides sp. ChNu-153]MDN7122121.1 ATP-binding cassette domain-containing protein [Nocardioides sp. ChNu-153]
MSSPGPAPGPAPVLELRGVAQHYPGRVALDGVDATVAPGTLLGLLGPNGSGKTTLLRVLLGLERPTAGAALVGGRPLARVARPAEVVGALLDCGWFHPRRSGRDHLRWMARAAGLPRARVEEVLDTVGLADAAGEAVERYSLGMRQRLGLAGALLGDPPVLVLDEPFNGLDHAATRWLAELAAARVAAGGTVVLSSHQLAELEPLVDRVLVLGRGRALFDGPVAELVAGTTTAVAVRLLDPVRDEEAARRALRIAGLRPEVGPDGSWLLPGAGLDAVATALAGAGVPVRGIEERGGGLGAAYADLVRGATLPGTPAVHPPTPTSAGSER